MKIKSNITLKKRIPPPPPLCCREYNKKLIENFLLRFIHIHNYIFLKKGKQR